MKKRINILICDTKESERFPGKNDLLLDNTINWLLDEVQDFSEDENVHIWYISRVGSGFNDSFDFNNCHIVFSPDNSISDNHKELLQWFDESYGKQDDVYVLLQLSQPIRRNGMLREAVDKVEDDNVVLSYTMWGSNAWRVVDNGTLEHESDRDDDIHRFYDGAIYVWKGNSAKIFDLKRQKKEWVHNYVGPVCDIDHPWEYERSYIKGLKNLSKQNKN